MNELATRRGAATRSRIVDVAREILATNGLERFVLREIAKRADIQLGNLQYYFPTREDLLEAVIREEFQHNLGAVAELQDNAVNLRDYLEKFTTMLVSEYTGIGGNIWPVLTVLHLHNRRFRHLSEEIYQQHFDVIIDGMRHFGVTGNSATLREKARLITAVIDGASLQAHTGPHSSKSRDWRSLCNHTMKLAVSIAKN